MGSCLSAKTSALPLEGATLIGSTLVSGRSIMMIGDKVLMPMNNSETGESGTIELDVKRHKIRIVRGRANAPVHELAGATRPKKRNDSSSDDEFRARDSGMMF